MTRYWTPRTVTKHGGIHPPRTELNRIGEPSSAIRRHEQRIHDRQILSNYVQLAPGILVVYDRQPWRVVEVAERPLDLWGAKYEERFAADVKAWERWGNGDKPERATWRSRPVAVVLVPDGEPTAKPLHLIGPAHHSWQVLPEHYAICKACGELPPCSHELAEREADAQMARTEVLMEIPAGHCLGCGEPITHRQKAVRFPGPNLWRPDLGDTARFHARQECSAAVDQYRQQWEAKGGEDPQAALPFEDNTAE